MSQIIRSGGELRGILKSEDIIFVLFYASWCPFSLRFLQIYEKHSRGREKNFYRMFIDGNEDVFENHEIEVYPTVILFQKGEVVRRLDGKFLAGLDENQLVGLIDWCGLKQN
jgi:thiol-disulfide isomerase/thioredoxin